MARAALLLTTAVALAGSAASCKSQPRGEVGESCTKRADCKDGLHCVEQTCKTEVVASPGGLDSSEDQDSDSATAPPNRPENERPTDAEPNDALDGAFAIAGEYSDLAAFCKDPEIHKNNDIYDLEEAETDGISSCDWSGKSMTSPHGEVQAILAGENAMNTGVVHVGIKRDSGLWVIANVGTIEGGNEAASSSELSRVKAFGDGTIGVEVAHEEYERIETNEGPGSAQGGRASRSKSQWRCGVAKTEEYVCKKAF